MIKSEQLSHLNFLAEKIKLNDDKLKIVILYEIPGYRFTATVNEKIICDCFSIQNLIKKLEAHLNYKEPKFNLGDVAWCIDDTTKTVRSFLIEGICGHNTISYCELANEKLYHLETQIFKTREEAIESQINHWEKMLINT